MKRIIQSLIALLLCTQVQAGGVTNGQPVNASVTNSAFLYKNGNDIEPYIIQLTNGSPSSGSSISNIQREFNALASYLGASLNQVYNYLPTWATNNRGNSSNSVFTRVEAIDTAFDGTSGHTHDGSTGNGPVLNIATATSGTLQINRGGTAGTTATAGFDNLSPLLTLGDTLYFDGSHNVALAGNTAATRKFLRQTGTGTVSAAPVWDTLLDADIPLTSAHILVGNGSNVAADVACSGDVTCANTGAITIANSAVTNAKMANMANNTVKANKSGGSAAPSDLTLSDVNETGSSIFTFANNTKSVVSSSALTIQANLSDTKFYVGNSSNYPVGVNMSGDATLADTGAVTIASNAVSNAKLAQMAAHTIKGNNTGSTANAIDLTDTQVTAELNQFTSSLQGVVPGSGGGSSNFLRADGIWAVPPGSGGFTNPMTTTGDMIYGGSGGTATRLAAGVAGQVLRSAGVAAPAWNFPHTTVAKSASYTVTDTDGYETFLITTGSSADVAITLPAAANNTNRKLVFKKVDSGTKKITITRAGSDTIDGYTTTNIGDGTNNQYSWIAMTSDGTNWNVVGVGGETLVATSTTVPTTSVGIVVSVTVPAGTWQIFGNMSSNDIGSATALRLGISTGVSTTYGSTADLFTRAALASNGTGSGITGPTLANVTSSTTYNVIANATGGSFNSVSNVIQAYRLR